MQVMLMRLMSKGEYLIVPKGTKFKGLGKLGLISKCDESLYVDVGEICRNNACVLSVIMWELNKQNFAWKCNFLCKMLCEWKFVAWFNRFSRISRLVYIREYEIYLLKFVASLKYVTWSRGMGHMSRILILSYRLKEVTNSYVLHCF